MKKILLYLFYIIVMFLFVYYGSILGTLIEEEAKRTFVLRNIILFSTIYPILIGLLLSFPQFLSKISKSGTWIFNFPKFIIVGIPALIGSLSLLLGNLIPEAIFLKLFSWAGTWGSTGTTICGILFGYTILNVLEKVDSQNIFISKKHSFYK